MSKALQTFELIPELHGLDVVALVSSNNLGLVSSRPTIKVRLGPVEAAATSDAPTIVPQPFVVAEFPDMDVPLRSLHF